MRYAMTLALLLACCSETHDADRFECVEVDWSWCDGLCDCGTLDGRLLPDVP